MTVSSISTGNQWLSQINPQNDATQTEGTSNASGSGAALPHGNRFFLALTQALSQIGVASGQGTPSSATSSPSSTDSASSSDPAQALAAFMQSLMAALHAESGQTSASAQGTTDSDGDHDGSGAVHGHGRHHGNLQADLQGLIQQLSASSGASSTSGTDASGSGTTDPALTSLEQNFQNLTSAFGNGGGATLQGFLQAFAGNLQNGALDGNVVNARA